MARWAAGVAGSPGVKLWAGEEGGAGAASDVAIDTSKGRHAGVCSRRWGWLFGRGVSLVWVWDFPLCFPVRSLSSFSFSWILACLLPQNERERKKKGHVCLEKYVGQWNIPCTCAREAGAGELLCSPPATHRPNPVFSEPTAGRWEARAGFPFPIPDPFCSPTPGLGVRLPPHHPPTPLPRSLPRKASELLRKAAREKRRGCTSRRGCGCPWARSAGRFPPAPSAEVSGRRPGGGGRRGEVAAAMKGRQRGCPRLTLRAATSRRTIGPTAPAPALPLPAARPT